VMDATGNDQRVPWPGQHPVRSQLKGQLASGTDILQLLS
jgi:hypothetical protein